MKKGIYKHFKGGYVKVLYISYHSENLEEYVVYKKLYETPGSYGKNSIWIRPRKMFLENVIYNNKCVSRFKYMSIFNLLIEFIFNILKIVKTNKK